jgi:hypothetical protein
MTITESNGTFTFSATDTNTDTNTSHDHSAGVGLVGSGSAGTSGGTYNYKAKLRSETALSVDSAAATTTSGRVYPVAVDKSGYLSVNVPWTDTDTNTDTKVTAVGNHYAPSPDAAAELTASLSGTAGAYAKDTEYTVLTGVKAQRDAKGHVTGLTYTAQKVKDTNTNTDAIYSGIGTCVSAAATAAKVVTLPKFALATNATILVRVSTTNSATSGVTLNVNSTGAKSIYIGGAAWSTSNQLNAGDYLATYDGTYWKLTRVYLTDNDTHYTKYLQIKGNGTEAVKFAQNADKSLNLKPGTNVSISAASGEITISATDTTYSSKAAASGGTAVSLVTTGEKYTWNNKTTLAEVEDYIEDNSEEVDLGTYFTKSDVNALINQLFTFEGTTLIIKDQ